MSYQGQTFAVPCFEHWLWWYRYFWSKVNIWNVNCVRATAFIFDTRMDVLVKMSKFFETENVSTWEGLEPSIFGFMPNALTIWAIWARHLLSHVLNTGSGSIDKMHIGISTTKYFPWARSLVVLVWLVTYLQSKPSSNYWIAAELFKSALLSIYSSSNRTYFTRKKQQDGVYHTFSCPNLSFIRNERSNSSSVM